MASINNSVWEYEKPVKASSTSTNPNSAKVRAIILNGSVAEDVTGNGSVGYDTSRIDTSSESAKLQSLVVTGPDGNETLPYHVENAENLGTSEDVVVWVYKNSWAHDGSVSFNIYFGAGDGSDYSMQGSGSNPWSQTGVNSELIYDLGEDPITATDLSPNNRDGTVNGPSSTSGQFGGAGAFDGSSDNIDTPFDPSSDVGSPQYSVIMYIRDVTSGSQDNVTFYSDDYYSLKYRGDYFKLRSQDSSNNGVSLGAYDDDPYTSNNWHQVGISYDGTTLKYFQDGVLKDSTDTGLLDRGENTLIGEGYGNFEGEIDAFKIINGVLSESWFTADFEESPVGGQTAFEAEAGGLTESINTDTVEKSNYDVEKAAEIGNLSNGNSFTNVAKVQPFKLTWGNSSESTGSGDCSLTETISSKNEFVVTDSDRQTVKNYEVAYFDSNNQEAWIWVYGSWSSDSSEQVVVLAGGGDGNDYSAGSLGDNPWSSVDAEMVVHNPANPVDSTGNYTDWSSGGSTNQGIMGDSGYFSRGERTVLNNSTSEFLHFINQTEGTLAFLLNPDTVYDSGAQSDRQLIFGTDPNINQSNREFHAMILSGTDGRYRFAGSDGGGNVYNINTNGGSADPQYESIVDTADGSNSRIFENGGQVASEATTSGSISGYDYDFAFAKSVSSSLSPDRDYAGEISSFRVYSGGKSSEWAQAEYDATPLGGQVFFSWNSSKPTAPLNISTGEAQNIGLNSAELNGSLDSLDNISEADLYFQYRKENESTWNETVKQTFTSPAELSESVSGLNGNTSYEFRLVADTSEGTFSGSSSVFKTLSFDGSVSINYPVGGQAIEYQSEFNYEFEISTNDVALDSVAFVVEDSSGAQVFSSNEGSLAANSTQSYSVADDGSVYNTQDNYTWYVEYTYDSGQILEQTQTESFFVTDKIVTSTAGSVSATTSTIDYESLDQQRASFSSIDAKGRINSIDLKQDDSFDLYFYYRKVTEAQYTEQFVENTDQTGEFIEKINGLDQGTEYRFFISVNKDQSLEPDATLGQTSSPATDEQIGSVTTTKLPVDTVPFTQTRSTIQLRGDVADTADLEEGDFYSAKMRWKEASASDFNEEDLGTFESPQTLEYEITGLSEDTEYDLEFVASGVSGGVESRFTPTFETSEGDVVSFVPPPYQNVFNIESDHKQSGRDLTIEYELSMDAEGTHEFIYNGTTLNTVNTPNNQTQVINLSDLDRDGEVKEYTLQFTDESGGSGPGDLTRVNSFEIDFIRKKKKPNSNETFTV